VQGYVALFKKATESLIEIYSRVFIIEAVKARLTIDALFHGNVYKTAASW
jgi:hypothetical protein